MEQLTKDFDYKVMGEHIKPRIDMFSREWFGVKRLDGSWTVDFDGIELQDLERMVAFVLTGDHKYLGMDMPEGN